MFLLHPQHHRGNGSIPMVVEVAARGQDDPAAAGVPQVVLVQLALDDLHDFTRLGRRPVGGGPRGHPGPAGGVGQDLFFPERVPRSTMPANISSSRGRKALIRCSFAEELMVFFKDPVGVFPGQTDGQADGAVPGRFLGVTLHP